MKSWTCLAVRHHDHLGFTLVLLQTCTSQVATDIFGREVSVLDSLGCLLLFIPINYVPNRKQIFPIHGLECRLGLHQSSLTCDILPEGCCDEVGIEALCACRELVDNKREDISYAEIL